MKTFNTIFGAIISFFLMLGIFFKIMHWPGAGPLIVVFSSFFSLYMIPVAIENIMNSEKKALTMINNIISAITGMILSVGLLFKIMHWPGASVMLVFGLFLGVIMILMLIILFISKKEPLSLNSGTFFSIICFGLLTYGVSVGGSSYALIVNASVTAEALEKNIDLVSEYNTTIIKNIGNNETQNSIKQIFEETTALNLYIHNLKKELYSRTDGIPSEVADTISISQIASKDNYDVPTFVLGLADPLNPKDGEYTATELKQKINSFNTLVKNNAPKTTIINVGSEDFIYNYGRYESWETSMFYHYTLSQVILSLNQIQLEANLICNAILTTHLIHHSSPHNEINGK